MIARVNDRIHRILDLIARQRRELHERVMLCDYPELRDMVRFHREELDVLIRGYEERLEG